MRNSILTIVLAFSVLLVCRSFISYQKSIKVRPDDLKGWINYLSSDEMRGRANGSSEMSTISKWLTERYREFGIKPIFADGEYIQNYSFTSRQRNVKERNIIGIIEGSDPVLKSQFIVLSAHFDHIGVRKGNSPDSIYNGADDNAAGTCTLLGIAKTIKDSGFKPGRTLIFAAFSGEESGMRGSRYFVANSPVPVASIYADLNFEMTGHSEYLGKNNYYMTGCKISDLDNLIGDYNKQSDWKLIDTISVANNLFYSSDNIAFSRINTANGITQGIPSGTFATTAMADYIHSQSDEGKLFDFENMAGLVNYFSGLVIWLSNNKTEVLFTDPTFTRVK
jgi:Zn-dependent M28 family amino/carboxypeptidase